MKIATNKTFHNIHALLLLTMMAKWFDEWQQTTLNRSNEAYYGFDQFAKTKLDQFASENQKV